MIRYDAIALFNDHVYKDVKGISQLHMRWGNQLEDAFQNGNAAHPLRNKLKGKTAYTEKFEANHSEVTRKLYRYVKQTIGNQSLFTFLAQTMNRKAEQMPELSGEQTKFNKNNVWTWF